MGQSTCKDCNRLENECVCGVGGVADGIEKGIAIGGGIAAAIGGIFLTVATGGVAAVVGGGILLGGGISSTVNGATHAAQNTRMNWKEIGIDVGVGSVTGVMTGGIGSVGETIAAKAVTESVASVALKEGAIKFGCRAGAGVVSGIASQGMNEAQDALKGQRKSAGEIWTNIGIGSLTGAIGGAAFHGSSNLTNGKSGISIAKSGVAKGLTRVGVSSGASAVSDATNQGIRIGTGFQKDGFSWAQVGTGAAVSGAITGGHESIKNAKYAAQGGKMKYYHNQMEEEVKKNIPQELHKEAFDSIDHTMKYFSEKENRIKLKSEYDVAKEYGDNQQSIKEIKKHNRKIGRKIGQLRRTEQSNPCPDIESTIESLKAQRKELPFKEPEKMGENAMHCLINQNDENKMLGKMAADFGPKDDGRRSANRLIYDIKSNDKNKYGKSATAYLSSFTTAHDYENLIPFKNKPKMLPSPHYHGVEHMCHHSNQHDSQPDQNDES